MLRDETNQVDELVAERATTNTQPRNLMSAIKEGRTWPIHFKMWGHQEKALVLQTDELLRRKGFILPKTFIMIPLSLQPSFKLIEPERIDNFNYSLKETAHLYTKYTEQEIFSLMGTIQFQSKDHPLWKAMKYKKIKSLNRIEQNHLIFLRQDGPNLLVYRFSLNEMEQMLLHIQPVVDRECVDIDSIIFSNSDSRIWKRQIKSKNNKKKGVLQRMFENFD